MRSLGLQLGPVANGAAASGLSCSGFGSSVQVHHDDILGQCVDVEYDDGDVETMKPIRRVRALESSESGSDADE